MRVTIELSDEDEKFVTDAAAIYGSREGAVLECVRVTRTRVRDPRRQLIETLDEALGIVAREIRRRVDDITVVVPSKHKKGRAFEDSLRVACPKCMVGPNAQCVLLTGHFVGEPASTLHNERLRAAGYGKPPR